MTATRFFKQFVVVGGIILAVSQNAPAEEQPLVLPSRGAAVTKTWRQPAV